METVHEKAERIKKLLAEKYNIHNEAELDAAIKANPIDISIFVTPMPENQQKVV